MPLIIGSQSATAAAGYSIANSCLFDQGDYLHRTPGEAGNSKTFTMSAWIKKTVNGQYDTLFGSGSSQYNAFDWMYNNNSKLYVQDYVQSVFTGIVTSDAAYTDPSAWYHVLFAIDTTQSVEANRWKMYVNGTQIGLTEGGGGIPAQDYDESVNATEDVMHVGEGLQFSGAGYGLFEGYMAEVIFIDGTAYAPSDFGEFNEDSPTIWQPKDPSGLTFGTNGFWLDFEDSADMGNDVSGNGNDLTLVNLAAINQCTDSPTNNFATLNPLDNYYAGVAFTEGNLKMVTGSNYTYNTGTIALSSGKWYFEFLSVVENQDMFGIAQQGPLSNMKLGGLADEYGYSAYSGKITEDALQYTYGSTWTDGAVIGCYLDIDNNKLYFANDGVIQNSGTGYDIVGVSTTANNQWFPSLGDNDSASGTYQMNFGNPPWTLTSAVADANGYGNFEYSPNDGGSASFDGSAKDFLAICTKNLGSDGG